VEGNRIISNEVVEELTEGCQVSDQLSETQRGRKWRMNLFGSLAEAMPLRLQLSSDHSIEAVEESIL
jgi:hypothetical protein